jgi:hypothetical protein
MAFRFSLRNAHLLLGLTLAALVQPSASAAVYTYGLHVGKYQINQDPSTFGTSGDVYLQLSNGASTNLNQTYTYRDILGLLATTTGTFAITPFQSVSYIGTGSDTNTFATTDSQGQLILNQPTINDPSLYPDGFNATSADSLYAIKWYLWTYDAITRLPIYYFKWSDIFSRKTASGKVTYLTSVTDPALVPEPASCSLLALGIGAMGAALRKSRRRPALAAG